MDTFGSFNKFLITPQGTSLVSILLPQSRNYVRAASFQLLLQNPRANSSLEFGFSGALNIHDLNCELYDDHVMTAFELEALDYILRNLLVRERFRQMLTRVKPCRSRALA